MISGFIEPNHDRYVTIHKQILPPEESQKIINHSPNGFSWGYGGSGPAQLALAILLRFCRVPEAIALHQQFKWDIIAKLPVNKGFSLADDRIHDWLETARRRK